MSCNPNDLLELARELGSQEECHESLLRCATSRGYYAALHTVDDTVPEVPGVERQRNEGSHAFVIRRALKYGEGANPGRLAAKHIVLAMKRLKDQRNDADYHLGLDYKSRDMEDALARVEVVMNHCNELQAAIDSYAARTGTS